VLLSSVRYVTDMVHEKLIGVVDCELSTGEYFVERLKGTQTWILIFVLIVSDLFYVLDCFKPLLRSEIMTLLLMVL